MELKDFYKAKRHEWRNIRYWKGQMVEWDVFWIHELSKWNQNQG